MILVLDTGNTHIVLGVYKDGKEDAVLAQHWRVSTDRDKTEDEYGMIFLSLLRNAGLDAKDITGAIIASVVPPLTPILEKTVQKYMGRDPVVVGPGTKTGVNVRYENPKEVGPDRIAHAVAAVKKFGAPAIVIDFGTATTLDAISKEGDYLGGAIAPGVLTGLDGLLAKAARLPKIELVKPGAAIGKTTVQSMQSGIIYGFAGLADGLIRRVAKEIGGNPHVIATGGLARMVAAESETIQRVEPFLVLDGLYHIYQRNVEALRG